MSERRIRRERHHTEKRSNGVLRLLVVTAPVMNAIEMRAPFLRGRVLNRYLRVPGSPPAVRIERAQRKPGSTRIAYGFTNPLAGGPGGGGFRPAAAPL